MDLYCRIYLRVGRREGVGFNPFRRANQEDSVFSAPVIVLGLLIFLGVLGGVGAMMVTSHNTEKEKLPNLGPKKNYATLPKMSLTLGGAQTMDLRVRLEFDPTVDPHITDFYADRIADSLNQRMTGVKAENFKGTEGAALIKNAIAAIVNREINTTTVRDVILDRLVIQ